MKKILSVMEGGLQGLSASENAAIRGRATREMERKTQKLRNEIANTAARSGVRGRALGGSLQQLARMEYQQQQDFEADLLERNIDIQDKRRRDYADTLRNAESDEFDRSDRATSMYGDTLSAAEQSEWDRGSAAMKDYTDYLSGLEGTEKQEKIDALDKLTGVNQWNLGQDAADKASKMAAITGLLGYGTAKDSAKKSFKLASSQGGSSGGGGGGGYDNSAYVGAVENIIDQQYGEGTSGSI